MEFVADTGYWQRKAGESERGSQRRKAVFEFLAPRANDRILDIGCGGGQLVRDLAFAVAPNGRAVGIDVSDEQLDAGRSFCGDAPCAEFHNADVCALDWDEGTFDGASSIQTLEYVPDVDLALREIRRVLKIGGRVAFVSVLWDTYQFHGAEQTLNDRVLKAFRAHCPHQMLPAEMPRRMALAGLGDTQQHSLTLYDGCFQENTYAYCAARFVASFVITRGLSEDNARDWLIQLARADQSGRFAFVSVPILSTGTAI